jgi:hypothetical protein
MASNVGITEVVWLQELKDVTKDLGKGDRQTAHRA